MNYEENYEKNRAALNVYQWWRHGLLPDWASLSIKAAKAGDNEYYFRIGEDSVKPIKIERTNANTKPFFRDLSKPLLLKNEFNTFNLEYVTDNVRKSENYGGDNHIYLYYDSIHIFALFLQVADITPYLKDNKLVFIFGEDELEKYYPLDFKGIYGIDYEAAPPKPLEIEEMNKIVLNWQVRPASSCNSFFEPVLFGHPNMIKLNTWFSFDQFALIYKCFLQGRTLQQFVDAFFTEFYMMPNWGGVWKNYFALLFTVKGDEVNNQNNAMAADHITDTPELQRFFSSLYRLFPANYTPKAEEWLKAFAISQAAAFEADYNDRIAPTITMRFNIGVTWGYIVSNLYPILNKFKYIRGISIIRRLAGNVGSHTDHHWLEGDPLLNRVCQFVEPDTTKKAFVYSGPLYLSPKDEMLPNRRIMRSEDFKLQPKASVEALCDFIDIPINDSFFETMEYGEPIYHINAFDSSDASTTGYETTSVYKKHDKRYSDFDYYRIELIMGKEYEYYGYKPKFYTDGKKYTNDEIMELFKKPWKVEKFDKTEYQKANQELVRQNLYEFVKQRLEKPFDEGENGEKLVPIPWLKPKEEFVEGKLYE